MEMRIQKTPIGHSVRYSLLSLVLAISACSTDGAGNTDHQAPVDDFTDIPSGPTVPGTEQSTPTGELQADNVVLDARLRSWTDQSIIIDYDLHNNIDSELIVLGYTHVIQTDRMPDGTVRLFKGKQETGDASFYETPTIDGVALAPAATLKGSGTRRMPLKIDYPANFDWSVDPDLDVIEFCIGYGLSQDLLSTRRDDGLYSLNQSLNLQQFACVTMQRESENVTNEVSALGDDYWRTTLVGVLDILDDDALHLVDKARQRLVLSEARPNSDVAEISFVTETGDVGTVNRVSCPDGGSFDLTTIGSAFGKEFVAAQNCMLSDMSIDGGIERSTAVSNTGNELETEVLDNFIVEDAKMRVQVFKGLIESDKAHPVSTSTLSDISYQVEKAGETRVMSNVELIDVDVWGTAYYRNLTGSFTVAAPWSFNKPIVVTMAAAINGLPVSSASEFTDGQLVLTTTRGDRLIFDFDSGQDDESAMVTLERSGSAVTTIVAWTDIFLQ